ncbi:MAG: NADH dehydrogenase [Anaerolineae bacterium]|nr:NADH dehydrogenase [Anaerolineae bacterium]
MTDEIWVAAPLACLAIGAFVVYLVARLVLYRFQTIGNAVLASITTIMFAIALATLLPLSILVAKASGTAHLEFLWPTWGCLEPGCAFLRADPGAVVVIGVALALGTLVSIYSGCYLTLDKRYETYYPLLLLLVVGLIGMVLAADLFNLYLFCELMSVTAYVLVAFRRRTDTAIEAGFKYLVMGSVGTVIMLMGISFIYREAESLALTASDAGAGPWTRIGVACFVVGLGIKSAIVPLHTWLPDAHGRAPSSISAMLSGIVIQSAFYVLLKISLALGFSPDYLGMLLIGLSLLNMIVGNSMALVQTNVKRLLAYSTVAQMGYMMFSIGIGLRYRIAAAIQAGFFFLIAHAATKGLAFLCKGVSHFYCDTTTIAQLRGTARRLPLVSVAMSVALAGLATVPPLAGFASKWFILVSVVRSRKPIAYAGLVVLVLNSLLALGYYLPLIATLFAPHPHGAEQDQDRRISISAWMALPLLVLGGLVLAIGIHPEPWLDGVASAGTYLNLLGR